jgi:hypothetical protein
MISVYGLDEGVRFSWLLVVLGLTPHQRSFRQGALTDNHLRMVLACAQISAHKARLRCVGPNPTPAFF